MPVHPLVAARFPLIDSIPVPLIDGIPDFDESLNNPEFTERFLAFAAPYSAYSMPDVQIEELTIDGPRGPIPIRLYRPRTAGSNCPGLLWVHGGAFVTGELDMPEAHVVSAEMAARGAVVASVDYRLATETLRYPAPLDDVDAAWRWFCSAAGYLRTDSSRLGIGGASAGGNLAAAATMRARDGAALLPTAMLLAYPLLHFPVPALSDTLAAEMRELPRMVRFLPQDIVSITRTYVGRLSDIPPQAMPGHANLAGLPATRILLSEYDDLRSSGELFEEQLRDVRVPVVSTVAAGMLHGHLNRTPSAEMSEIERSLDFLAEALMPAEALREIQTGQPLAPFAR